MCLDSCPLVHMYLCFCIFIRFSILFLYIPTILPRYQIVYISPYLPIIFFLYVSFIFIYVVITIHLYIYEIMCSEVCCYIFAHSV